MGEGIDPEHAEVASGGARRRGLISIYSAPLSLQIRNPGYPYAVFCEESGDLEGVNELSLHIPQPLEEFFDRLIKELGNQNRVYTPCIVGECIDEEGPERRSATLLAPPGINRDSALFYNGMAVPDLKIVKAIERENFSLKSLKLILGYVLVSDHLGPQELFVPPLTSLQQLNPAAWPDITFEGMIRDAHKGKKEIRPYVRLTLDSAANPGIFAKNAGRLMELGRALTTPETKRERPGKFWWEYSVFESGQIEL